MKYRNSKIRVILCRFADTSDLCPVQVSDCLQMTLTPADILARVAARFCRSVCILRKQAWMDEKRKKLLGFVKAHPNNLLALLE
jgi:hypothetical protein